jgi:regulator of cell morphogenesis and NO signaling
MNVHLDTEVGRIAAEHPLATRVFARHGIDYCCGGGVPLAEACRSKGLDADAVIEEVRRGLGPLPGSEVNWSDAPLVDLVRHILAAYHQPLKEELSRLEAMARKVLQVHREKEPEMLPELVSVYVGLKSDLEPHMMKEETILFPMIEGGQWLLAEGPISMMRMEHDTTGAALRRLRELTRSYQLHPRACNTWRALWHGLAALEESLHQHIHLENNILFPRALGS